MGAREPLPPPRCMNCGYNVRGVRSDICPECGQEYYIAVGAFQEAGRFNAAAATLAEEGIEYRQVSLASQREVMNQLMGAGGSMANFGAAALFVKRNDWPKAKRIMDEIAEMRPIVDRAEPICPKCDAALDSHGAEVCPRCGAEFQWVDIEEPLIDPSGRACHKCGYELTGNLAGGRCPECGASLPGDESPQSSMQLTRFGWPCVIGCVLMMVFVTILAMFIGSSQFEILQALLLASAAVATAHFIIKYIRWRRR